MLKKGRPVRAAFGFAWLGAATNNLAVIALLTGIPRVARRQNKMIDKRLADSTRKCAMSELLSHSDSSKFLKLF